MRQFFKNHPMISYNNQQMRNLLVSAQLTRQILDDTTSFLPYTVQEGETPTTIAFDYYGHVDYTWLVLFSNHTIDVYTDWPKTQEQFNEYILKQYSFTTLQPAFSTIHHYVDPSDPTYPLVTPTTYQFLDPSNPLKARLRPVSIYDHEMQLNEAKRAIVLVDKVYAARIALELEKKLSA